MLVPFGLFFVVISRFRKNPEKNAFSPLLGSQATARLTPILDTLLDTFLCFFEKTCLHHTFTKRFIFAGFDPFGNQCLHHTFTKRFIFAGFDHFARPANITLRASCPAGHWSKLGQNEMFNLEKKLMPLQTARYDKNMQILNFVFHRKKRPGYPPLSIIFWTFQHARIFFWLKSKLLTPNTRKDRAV